MVETRPRCGFTDGRFSTWPVRSSSGTEAAIPGACLIISSKGRHRFWGCMATKDYVWLLRMRTGTVICVDFAHNMYIFWLDAVAPVNAVAISSTSLLSSRHQWSQGCFQPNRTGPSFLARYINCALVSPDRYFQRH